MKPTWMQIDQKPDKSGYYWIVGTASERNIAGTLASGSCHTLDEACRCARIAWEQHSKDEPCA
jgi:hypothetical protein